VLLALRTLDPEKYSGAIRRAQEYIKGLQLTEVKGFEESKHVTYGAITYGDGLKADLSNTQYAAEALYASGLSGSDELWRRLAVFVSRCQNAETIDPILAQLNVGTTKDGGFRYGPADTRGPTETLDDGTKVYSSYGSMTYAGLKSLLYAQVDKEDVRVKQAFSWITKNFTVRENPGMASKQNPAAGQQGLFYYYQTMAKALSVYDQPIIKDAKGVEHKWAKELSDHLISLQESDGSWKGKEERWWENIPALDTAYAIIALTDCQAVLEKMPKASATPPAAAPAPGATK
jgi:squalene-hopene/tetraprenyl-beta-curcumene cyclase